MPAETGTSWAMLVALGAFHGINPGMGWLFAVALGMQERRRGAVFAALAPLGAGHALAVGAAVGLALALGTVLPLGALRSVTAAVLIALGLARVFRHRHARWASMRVNAFGLTLWSFLMATAHGAGLMVVPVFLSMTGHQTGGAACHLAGAASGAGPAIIATALHALGYIAVTAAVAVVVFEKLGVGLLRRAWLNLDGIWAGALVITGVLTLLV